MESKNFKEKFISHFNSISPYHKLISSLIFTERLLSGYEILYSTTGWGDPKLLSTYLTKVKLSIHGDTVEDGFTDEELLDILKLVPSSDLLDTDFTTIAQEVATMVYYIVEAIHLDSNSINKIPNRCIEIVHQVVYDKYYYDGISASQLLTKIDSDPLMVEEINTCIKIIDIVTQYESIEYSDILRIENNQKPFNFEQVK